MAVISVTMNDTGWTSATPLEPAMAALPPGAAVTVMIHGYRYSPRDPAHDPHRHILSPTVGSARWKSVSWARHLHLDRPGAGLGIGLGWHARGSLRSAARHAFETGEELAGLISKLKMLRPDLHVNLIAHSLGARVALRGLATLPARHVDRVILLSAAEYRSLALAALASPAGRGAQVLNVTSGENLLFDCGFRIAVPAPHLRDWPLAAGLPGTCGWTDLRIDCQHSRAALERAGFRIRPPGGHICHWSSYLRPGLFRLYRAVCDPDRAELLPGLAATLPRPAPRRPHRGAIARLSPL